MRALAALFLLLLAPLAWAQDSHTIELYKIRATGSGSPKEIPEELEGFAALFRQMSFRVFEQIEKDTRQVTVGDEATFRLSDTVTLNVKLLEKISDTKLRVEVRLYDEEAEEQVLKVKLAIRLETPFMVDAPDDLLPGARLLLGIEIR